MYFTYNKKQKKYMIKFYLFLHETQINPESYSEWGKKCSLHLTLPATTQAPPVKKRSNNVQSHTHTEQRHHASLSLLS